MSPVHGAVPWAVVASGCAAVVCLAAWPRPTLWALGIVIGAAALLAGLRGLLAEQRRRTPAGPSRRHALADNREFVRLSVRDEAARAVLAALDADTPTVSSQAAACAGCAGCGGPDCAQRPDISGRDPEAARTHPDATRQQDADQAGDHPDALRTRLADTFGLDPNSTWTALLDRAADVDHIAQQLAPAQAEATRLREELAALHEGEQPYTDESTVPTPAQWIWRWNHATPAERLEHAARAIARTDRLAAVYAVLVSVSGRSDLTADAINARVRAALNAETGR